MEGHHQGPPRPQAPARPDGAGHRARRDVRLGHARAHRHAERHVQQPVRPTSTRTSTSRSAATPPSPAEAVEGRAATRSPSRSPPRCARCPAWPTRRARSRATPSSSPPPARPSAPAARRPSALSFDPEPAAVRAATRAGHAPTTPHEVVIDAGTATKYHFRVGEQVRILLTGPPQTFTISGIVTVRHGRQPRRRHDRRLRPAHRPAAVRRGRPVRRDQRPCHSRGRQSRSCSAAIARSLPARRGGRDRPDRRRRAVDRPSTTPSSFFSTALLVFAFISLFVGGVHDLQHVLDHRRPADARARTPADPRGEPPPGLPLGARRGGHRGPGRLAGRPRPRGARRRRPRGAAEGLRDHAARRARSCSRPAPWSPRLVVGIGVTVVSAISPARRAVRIPPMAAIADHGRRDRPVVPPAQS